MNHDPLCPNQHDPDPKCHACHLIDMARQKERALVAVDRTTLAELNAEYRKGLDAAREAIAAAYDDERYAHSDDWGVPVVYKDLMLAAIDALRGEQ